MLLELCLPISGFACDREFALSDGKTGRVLCLKSQSKMVRVVWLPVKLIRAGPAVASILVALTSAPTGNWKWMSSNNFFISEAVARIAKNRKREPIAFVIESEVKDCFATTI